MSKITKDYNLTAVLLNSGKAEAEAKTEKKPKAEPKKSGSKKPAAKKNGSKDKNTENRTRRVQAVLPPKLYKQLNDAAWKSRQSVNETIIQAITEYLERR